MKRSWITLVFVTLIGVVGCGGGNDRETGIRESLKPLPVPATFRVDDVVRVELEELSSRVVAASGDLEESGSTSAEWWGKLGMTYFGYELFGPALVCLDNAVVLDPDDPRWSYYRGKVLHDLDRPEDAAESLGHAAALVPDWAFVRFSFGQALADAGRDTEAEVQFAETLRLEPSFAAAHLRLGQLAADRGDSEGAVAEFERVLALQPGATRVHGMIAVEYRRMGRDELAQKHLDRRGDGQISIADPLLEQISEVSGGASLLVNQGVAASEAGDLLEARRLFEEALALEPDNAPARLNLGVTLVGLGLPDEARQELELARDRAPENSRVHFNLGTLLSAGGETSQAIDAYRAAIRLDPGYTAAIFNLANAHLRVGDYPSAIDEYRRVIDAQPSNAGARLGEVVAMNLAGRERDALVLVEESLVAAPDDPSLLQAHARLLATASVAELRDGEQAHQIALLLMSQQRVLAHVETLAMALAELGDFEGAVRWQRAAGEAVRASGREDLLPFVTANLARYEAGLPCRRAWDPAGL